MGASGYINTFFVILVDEDSISAPLANESLDVTEVGVGLVGSVVTDEFGVVVEQLIGGLSSDSVLLEFSHGAYTGIFRRRVAPTVEEASIIPENSTPTFVAENLSTAERPAVKVPLWIRNNSTPEAPDQFLGYGTTGETTAFPYETITSARDLTLFANPVDESGSSKFLRYQDGPSADVEIPTISAEGSFTPVPANHFFAGPTSGTDDDPGFRAIVTADLPNNVVTLAKLATQAANTILGNATGSAAVPTAVAVGANSFLARSSSGNLATKSLTDFALTILDDGDGATVRTTIGATGGSGTANMLPKWSASSTLTNSQIFDNGTTVEVRANEVMIGNLGVHPAGIYVDPANDRVLIGDVNGVSNSKVLSINDPAGTCEFNGPMIADSFSGDHYGDWFGASIPIAFLGASTFVKTLLDDTTAMAFRTTLGIDDNDAVTFGDLTVNNLTVNGTTLTVNSTTVTVDDCLFKYADNNAADSLDIGFYGQYTSSGAKYTGLFRDATDGKFRLFTGLQSEPTTTVNLAGTGYTVATLVANLESGAGSIINGSINGMSGFFPNTDFGIVDLSGSNTLRIVPDESYSDIRYLRIYNADSDTSISISGATVLQGSNTGDQTSIAGISGTTAQFNTSLSDNDFCTLAGSETLTNKTLTTPAITSSATVTNTSVGASSTDGSVLQNTTAATSGNQKWSPRLRWSGRGWKTNATAASQTVDFIAEVQSVEGAANPSANWVLSSQINGGGYTWRLAATSGGIVQVNTALDVYTAGGASGSNASGTFRAGNDNNYLGNAQLAFAYNATATYRHNIRSRHNSAADVGNSMDFYLWRDSDNAAVLGSRHVMTIAGIGAGSVGIGLGALVDPSAKFHVLEATLGNAVQRLQTTAPTDDPMETTYQGAVTTANNTQTTLATFTVPASTTFLIKAHVVARRTGGASGTAEDGAGYEITAVYKNVAGTATIIGAMATDFTGESQAGWDATFDVTGATVRCRVTGATNNNVTWNMTAKVWQVSS